MSALHAVSTVLRKAGIRRVVCPSAEDPMARLAADGLEPIVCPDLHLGAGIADGAVRASAGAQVVPLSVSSPAELAQGMEIAASSAARVLLISMPRDAGDASEASPRLVGDAAEVARRVDLALDAVAGAACGLVVLEFSPHPPDARDATPGVPARARPASALRETAARILGARGAVVLAGPGVRAAGAERALGELAQWAALPVATTPLGRGVFPEAHPLALGSTGPGALALARTALAEADVLVAVGLGAAELAAWTTRGGPPVTVVLSAEADAPEAAPGATYLGGDLVVTLQMLLACAKDMSGFAPRPTRGVPERIAVHRAHWLATWRARLASATRPLSPYRVVAECQRVIPPRDALFVPDCGPAEDALAMFYPAAPQSYLAPGDAQPAGAVLGVAIGAQLACPQRVCVHLTTRPAERAFERGIAIAQRCGLPLITALLGADLRMARVASVVAARGVHVQTVEDPADIAPAFARAREVAHTRQPALLRFVTES